MDYSFKIVDINRGANSFLDMYLMSLCKSNIIANSSFSWWGAWLNNNKNKIECRPIVTGNFIRNEVMKYFDYKVHRKLKNADYLHYNGFMVGNSPNSLPKSLNLLKKILP